MINWLNGGCYFKLKIMKRTIWEITINKKYVIYVIDYLRSDAEKTAKEFYTSNNYFIEKGVKTISSKAHLECSKIINLKSN